MIERGCVRLIASESALSSGYLVRPLSTGPPVPPWPTPYTLHPQLNTLNAKHRGGPMCPFRSGSMSGRFTGTRYSTPVASFRHHISRAH